MQQALIRIFLKPSGRCNRRSSNQAITAKHPVIFPFTLAKAKTIREAAALAGTGTAYIAGGTNLLDLMKTQVAKPQQLIAIGPLDLKKIAVLPNGSVRIGALVTQS